MTEADVQFAIPLREVLVKYPPVWPESGDIALRVAFGTVEHWKDMYSRDVDPQKREANPFRISHWFVNYLIGNTTGNDIYVLDAAKRAVETDHEVVQGFSDTDKRFMLHLAAEARMGQLERIIRRQEAISTYYSPDHPYLRMSTGREVDELAKVRTFITELSQKATSPIHEAPRT